MEYFFAVCGALTLEGGPIFWVATHRIHHQKSDQPGDPHSPRDGAWWSHVGWILFGETNHNNTRMMSKYAPDLAKHPLLRLAEQLPLGADRAARPESCYAIGGLPLVLWGICLRMVVRPARHLAGEFRHPHVGHRAASPPATIRATTGGWR